MSLDDLQYCCTAELWVKKINGHELIQPASYAPHHTAPQVPYVSSSHPWLDALLTFCHAPLGFTFSSCVPVLEGAQAALHCLIPQPITLSRRWDADSPSVAIEWLAAEGCREGHPKLFPRLKHCQRRRTPATCNKRWVVQMMGGG